MDATAYSTFWIRDRWLRGTPTADEAHARAAGARFFADAYMPPPTVGPNGGWATSFVMDGWRKLRNGEWSMIDDPRPRVTFSGHREIDGWWRECTPAERERLRRVVIRCAVHAPDDDVCGAAEPGCVQVMRAPADRRYRERVIR